MMPIKKVSSAVSGDSDTRNKILDTAAMQFALKGFKAVTLKEIAKEVGIKIASIYYYYEDKEALIEDVLSRFDKAYNEHYNWLSEMNGKAETLEDVMGNLFNREFFARIEPITRFGMSMTLREQHSNNSAYKYAFEHIYDRSVKNVQAGFDRLIEKKIIPPSDTKTLATLFMFCVMSGNEMHIHELTYSESPFDSADIYIGLRKLITAALRQGIIGTN